MMLNIKQEVNIIKKYLGFVVLTELCYDTE